jgi:hypothetical protein
MRTNIVAPCLVAASLSACGPQMVWVKLGLTQAQFNVDRYQCEREAMAAAPNEPIPTGVYRGPAGYHTVLYGDANAADRDDLAIHCMEARGYTLQPLR